jgi:hypothetical protein
MRPSVRRRAARTTCDDLFSLTGRPPPKKTPAQLGATVIDTPTSAPPPPSATHVAAWHLTDPAARAVDPATHPGRFSDGARPPTLVSPLWVWQCASARRRIPIEADTVYRPLPYESIAGAAECEVTLSGFTGDFRTLVLAALAATGATATKAMSLATATHVVAPDVDDAASAKIARAKSPSCASRIAVVNPAWLWDGLRRGRVMPASPYVFNLLHGPEPLDGLVAVTSGEAEAAEKEGEKEGEAGVGAVPQQAGAKRPADAGAPSEARRLRFTQVSAGTGEEGGSGGAAGDENAAPPPAAAGRKTRGGGGLKGGAPASGLLPAPTAPPTESQMEGALALAGAFVHAPPTQAGGGWRSRGGGPAAVEAAAVAPPAPVAEEEEEGEKEEAAEEEAPAAVADEEEAGPLPPPAAPAAADAAVTVTAAAGRGKARKAAAPARAALNPSQAPAPSPPKPAGAARAKAAPRRASAPAAAAPPTTAITTTRPSFVVGGLHTAEAAAVVAALRRLGVSAEGGAAAARWRRGTTHLVEPRLRRTAKTLAAMASGAWVLGTGYVDACVKAGRLVPEEAHELLGAGSGGGGGNGPAIAPRAVRHWRERAAAAGGAGAFAGLRVAILPGLAPAGARPDRDDLVRIVEAGGGLVVAAGGGGGSAGAPAPSPAPDLAIVPPGCALAPPPATKARRVSSSDPAAPDPRAAALAAAGVPCAGPGFVVDWLAHPAHSAATLAAAHLVGGSPPLGALVAGLADGRGRVRMVE